MFPRSVMQFLVVTSTNGKKLLTNVKRPAADVLDIPQTPVDTYVVLTSIMRQRTLLQSCRRLIDVETTLRIYWNISKYKNPTLM